MSNNDRIIGNIGRDTLVFGALGCGLIGRHANGIGYDPGENFIVCNRREFKGLETQIILSNREQLK